MAKFDGSLEELKQRMASAGVRGEWTAEEGQGKHVFTTPNRGVLNWWPKTKTLNVQGKADAKAPIERALLSADAGASQAQPSSGGPLAPRQIFIVHGHDAAARDELELALHRLGLDPYVLMNRSGGGKTLIEALEGKIGRDYSSDFGIVLMTPDDFGYAKKDGPEKGEPRARQNVVLEAGMLLASLTRKRMAIVVKGHVELPSDIQGIIRLNYNEHVKEIVPKLCPHLREVGFELNPDKIAEATQ